MPRLGHKKSRLGCRQCKARHVKCDELVPCGNCSRHGVMCSLVDPNAPTLASSASSALRRTNPPSVGQPVASSSAASMTSLHINHVLNPPNVPAEDSRSLPTESEEGSSTSSPDAYPFLSRFLHHTEVSSSAVWLRDLELLHHWTTESYDDLSQRDDMRHTWMVVAPKHAVTHPFLMHEILAFAAFHKAYKDKERQEEYYSFGIHHQDLAIRGIREKLHNITSHEAAELVATSTLLTLSVFASTGFEAKCAFTATPQGAIDGILNCFNLMQGMGNVLALEQTTIRESWIAPMLRDPQQSIPSQPLLQELLQHIPTLVTFMQGKRDLPELERELYLETIATFEPVLQMSLPPRVDNRELRFLFFWPLHLGPAYLNLVRQRHSGALVILMYYATILFASEPRYWFMDGWGQRLLRTCYDAVDQSWSPALQWPLSLLNPEATYDLFANLLQQRQGPVHPAQMPHAPQRSTSCRESQSSTAVPSTRREGMTNAPWCQNLLAIQIQDEDQKPITTAPEVSRLSHSGTSER